MPAVKQKWCAMRISKPKSHRMPGFSRAFIGLAAALLAVSPATAEKVTFNSTKEALKQGISAYSGGYYEMAIPALKYASEGKEFMADFYLARIYSDNSGSHTNHAAAYDLFRRIADESSVSSLFD